MIEIQTVRMQKVRMMMRGRMPRKVGMIRELKKNVQWHLPMLKPANTSRKIP